MQHKIRVFMDYHSTVSTPVFVFAVAEAFNLMITMYRIVHIFKGSVDQKFNLSQKVWVAQLLNTFSKIKPLQLRWMNLVCGAHIINKWHFIVFNGTFYRIFSPSENCWTDGQSFFFSLLKALEITFHHLHCVAERHKRANKVKSASYFRQYFGQAAATLTWTWT